MYCGEEGYASLNWKNLLRKPLIQAHYLNTSKTDITVPGSSHRRVSTKGWTMDIASDSPMPESFCSPEPRWRSLLSALGSMNRTSVVGELLYSTFRGKLFGWCTPPEFKDGYLPRTQEEGSQAESVVSTTVMQVDGEKNVPPEKGPQSLTGELEIVIGWDGPDDPENPYNWPTLKKTLVCFIIGASTMSQYMGAGIFVPAEDLMQAHFQTSETKLLLGLTMFVWGYGLSALWFSPMSENPLFGGRNYIYIACQLLFVCMQIPTALSNHIATFIVLRFIAGIMASPSLSTGAATFSDMLHFPHIVWALIGWSLGAVGAPYIGPLLGGALVTGDNWRWIFWYLMIQGAAVLAVMAVFLPETSTQALLMRKAARLRQITGNHLIVAPGDLVKRYQTTGEILQHIFWRPIEIMCREPVVALINLHISLVYALTYLFFDAFPVGFTQLYHFSPLELGAAYVSLLVGVVVAVMMYSPCLMKYLIIPTLEDEKLFDPEKFFGTGATFGAVGVPVGVFLYGWTTHEKIPWVISLIGAAIFAGSTWIMFQSENGYLSRLYPASVTASAFASNTICRCMLAGSFPLFGYRLFSLGPSKFPVGWGCTIVAVLAALMILLPLYLRIYGRALRQKAFEKYGSKLMRDE